MGDAPVRGRTDSLADRIARVRAFELIIFIVLFILFALNMAAATAIGGRKDAANKIAGNAGPQASG